MEAVFTDYASQGYDLIIGHSFSFGDAALAVAERYPDTKFIVIDGTVSSENVASYTLKMQEVGYLEGIAAGMMTKQIKSALSQVWSVRLSSRLLRGTN